MGTTTSGTAYGRWGPEPGRAGPDPSGQWNGPWRFPYASRPFWIVLTILAFMAWWPIGLALLFYLIGSGRMGCRGYRAADGAQQAGWGRGAPGWWGPWGGWRSFCGAERSAPSSGNRAFDEYRAETLRRLEEEQKEFGAFLDRLRFAKDKAEFDAFMAERRQRQEPPAEPPPGSTV
jgi:hypothetical protein